MKRPNFYLEKENGDRWNWQADPEYRFEINYGSIAVFRDKNSLIAVFKGLRWYLGYQWRMLFRI